MDRIKRGIGENKICLFCWMKALFGSPLTPLQGYGMQDKGGGGSGPGRNGRCPGEPIPFWPGSTTSALGLVPTQPANGGHPILGAGGMQDLSLTR